MAKVYRRQMCFNGAAIIRSRKWSRRPGRQRQSLRASMGPRSFDRGNDVLKAARGASPVLLQWGRDHSIAEMRQRLRAGCLARQCFNGAAIIRSRKSGGQ